VDEHEVILDEKVRKTAILKRIADTKMICRNMAKSHILGNSPGIAI
jgi:hypothetical protein